MAEQGTHKPLVVSSNLTLGTPKISERLFIYYGGLYRQEVTMISLKNQDQGIIELLNQDYLPVLAESFLIDRKSQGLSIETIRFYILFNTIFQNGLLLKITGC